MGKHGLSWLIETIANKRAKANAFFPPSFGHTRLREREWVQKLAKAWRIQEEEEKKLAEPFLCFTIREFCKIFLGLKVSKIQTSC